MASCGPMPVEVEVEVGALGESPNNSPWLIAGEGMTNCSPSAADESPWVLPIPEPLHVDEVDGPGAEFSSFPEEKEKKSHQLLEEGSSLFLSGETIIFAPSLSKREKMKKKRPPVHQPQPSRPKRKSSDFLRSPYFFF